MKQMAKKERRLTDDLSVALSGIDAALSIMGSVGNDPAQLAKLVRRAREGHDEAHAALVKIKRAAEQI